MEFKSIFVKVCRIVTNGRKLTPKIC
jgi:hypothetical protein